MPLTAQVIKQVGKQFVIQDGNQQLTVFTRKKAAKAVCGDYVQYEVISGEAVITAICERDNVLSRTGFRKQVKPVAANLTQLCIVCAPFPGIHSEIIDRYIIAASKLGLSACVIFNKSDLLEKNREQVQIVKKLFPIYQKLNIHVISTNIHDTESINKLRLLLKNHTSIFAGESGVGKSSLIQEVIPELKLRIGELSQISQLGRHTTTHSELFTLDDGAKIIDSPGVRSFDISHFAKPDIQYGFEEFRELAYNCKYNDCTHIAEPEKACLIKQAVTKQTISQHRYDNYKLIYEYESDYN